MFEDVDGPTFMTLHTEASLSGISGLLAPVSSRWARRVQQRGFASFNSDVATRQGQRRRIIGLR